MARLKRHWPAKNEDGSLLLGLQPDGRFDIGGLLLGPAFLATLDQVQPLTNVSRFGGPVLIVHGTEDEAVPPIHAELYQQAVGDQHATLRWIQGADHVFSAHAWEEEVFRPTLSWLQDHLPTA